MVSSFALMSHVPCSVFHAWSTHDVRVAQGILQCIVLKGAYRLVRPTHAQCRCIAHGSGNRPGLLEQRSSVELPMPVEAEARAAVAANEKPGPQSRPNKARTKRRRLPESEPAVVKWTKNTKVPQKG